MRHITFIHFREDRPASADARRPAGTLSASAGLLPLSFALFLCLLPASFARAQQADNSDSNSKFAPPNNSFSFLNGPEVQPIPQAVKNLTMDPHPNAQVPLDLQFLDEDANHVKLAQYFMGRRPVVLQIGYFSCPMLCGLVTKSLVDSLNGLTLDAGKDYEVLYVSIDPRENPGLAHAKKESILASYQHPGSKNAWHLLTGTKDQIDKLTKAVGYNYLWVASANQYAHPACLILLTPQGKVARYLYGVHFDPSTLRLSLVEASNGKIGTIIDGFLLCCFRYDGKQGKYALAAINLMKMAGLLTLLILGLIMYRIYTRRARPQLSASPGGANADADTENEEISQV